MSATFWKPCICSIDSVVSASLVCDTPAEHLHSDHLEESHILQESGTASLGMTCRELTQVMKSGLQNFMKVCDFADGTVHRSSVAHFLPSTRLQ